MEITGTDFDHPTGTTGTVRAWPTGTYVNLLDPQPATIHVVDVAQALANICRFGGHLPSHYSVAEHSLHVAAQLWRITGSPALALAKAGLVHDAAEAYGDMVRPLKHSGELDAYKVFEARMDAVICTRFGIHPADFHHPDVDQADKAILPWEMAMIRDAPWRTPTPVGDVVAGFLAAFERYGLLAHEWVSGCAGQL